MITRRACLVGSLALILGACNGERIEMSIGESKRTRNWRVGRISRVFSPGYSHCMKCLTTWNLVDEHSVWVKNGYGCFALCELCWAESTQQERVAYHEQVWTDNLQWGEPHYSLDELKEAVMEDRQSAYHPSSVRSDDGQVQI